MPRKILKNDNYFSIPNERNSYWAGFIAADGNIFKNRLTISQSDYDKIKQFSNEIDCNAKISLRNSRLSVKKHYCIQIVSNKLTKDLLDNFNIPEKKSLILEPPILNRKLSLCYLAGLIDGDGSIGQYSNGNGYKIITVYLASTKKNVSMVFRYCRI